MSRHGTDHSGPEGLGPPRRPRRPGRARPALHRPPPRPRGHQPAGLRRPAADRPHRPPPRPHGRHRGPQRPDRPTSTSRSRTRSAPSRSRCCGATPPSSASRLYPMGDAEPGHRPRDRARAGPHAAGHDDRVRRLATPPPTARSARWPSASAPARSSTCWPPRRCRRRRPKWMAVTVDGDLPAGVTAKDVILAIIGRIGTGGGIGHVIEYRGLGHPRAVDGRPHDGLQHVASRPAPGPAWSPPTTRRSPTSRAAATPRRAPTGSRRSTTGARCAPTTAPRSTTRS